MTDIYILGSLILIAVVMVSALLDRWSVPVILIALGAGILFGSDVLNLIDFGDMALTNQIANVALVFILFHGGFGTKAETFKSVALPAGGMATWGVLLTSITTFAVLWGLLQWPMEKALLLAVIISSTDAAATFSILGRQQLPKKLSATVEIESAANDPMAVLLTMAAIQVLTVGDATWYMMVLDFVWKFAAGIGVGYILGHVATWVLNRLRPQDRGHYYVLSLGIVMLIYGIAEQIRCSGMLAVFVAGFILGNKPFVHKQGVSNFVSALSTIADTGMFVLMGLLVYPRQWSSLWLEGVLLFLVLTFISRPVAVMLGTLGMNLGRNNKLFMAWAGLRGAVPIVLATYPMAAGMEIGNDIFNLVFFAVILSVAVQGSSIGFVAKWLRLATEARPSPLYSLELVTMAPSDMDLIVVDLPGPLGRQGPKIADLRLPAGSVITLITRGSEVVVPKGSTHLEGWDQVTVLAHVDDESDIRSMLTTSPCEAAVG